MGAVNVDMLLKEVSAEKPCGEDLRYNGRFLEVLRMAETAKVQEIGKPGEPGHRRIEPEEPPWRDVRDGCFELMSQTKHLRLAVVLCLAQVRIEGYPGLRDALAVLRGYLETYWTTVYPQLDPDDNNDPTERANILKALSAPIGDPDDPFRFLERVRDMVLLESSRIGRITHKDIVVAMGEVVDVQPPPGAEPQPGDQPKPQRMELPVIDAAFAEADPATVEQTARTVEECLEHIRAIDKAFSAQVGVGNSPDLSRLIKLVDDAAKQVRKRIGVPGGAEAGAAGGFSGGGGAAPARLAGEVRSPEDVRVAIDKIIRYYEDHEPSSPVALIALCARKMVSRKYLDISRVLDPSSVQVLEKIATSD